MISFELTEEQQQFKDLAHEFAEKEMRPVAAEYDEKEEFPWPVLKKAAEVGLLSYAIPEEYGGVGIASILTHCLIAEELFWGCPGIATAMGGIELAATPILLAGSEAQKSKYLSLLCDPKKVRLGAYALTEPNAGSDAAAVATTARREGDYYILNGTKQFITNGGIADVYVIFATLDKSKGAEAITAFIVDGNTPGLIAGKKEKKMGIRASHTAQVILEDCKVPVENRLGEEGEGFVIAMKTFDHSRPGVAAGAVGVARAAMEYANEYALQRVQFGRPIGKFQTIGFMLADMATKIDAARLLTWRAAWALDAGLWANREASMAKLFAADVAMQVTTDAVQILGGYGYSRDYPVERWMRDAKIMQIYEGTTQIQRLIIARSMGC